MFLVNSPENNQTKGIHKLGIFKESSSQHSKKALYKRRRDQSKNAKSNSKQKYAQYGTLQQESMMLAKPYS